MYRSRIICGVLNGRNKRRLEAAWAKLLRLLLRVIGGPAVYTGRVNIRKM
jgi:hypothetical protein